MIKILRNLAIAGLLLPVCLPLAAATSGISNKVQQSLKANKINSQSLSVVTVVCLTATCTSRAAATPN